MLTDEMKKSIEEIVEAALSQMTNTEEVNKSEEKEDVEKANDDYTDDEKEEMKKKKKDMKKSDEEKEEVEKSEMPKEHTPENGGKDKMKSGSPHQEKQSMMKSLEELSEILPEDEVELIAAWREENSTKSEEPVTKSQSGLKEEKEDLGELVKAAVASSVDDLKKAISDKDELIKSMQDKIEKMASRPAYDKRSVDSLEPVEKSGDSTSEALSKSQVLDTMLDLQKAGKGITSYHVAEYEGTENISDPRARQLVLDACKKA